VLVSHNPTELVLLCDRVLVLSRRPPHIAGVVEIDLSRPRGFAEAMNGPRFGELERQIKVLFAEARERCECAA
jgi:NitT/TauT family transport system ATP-binding protein